jgi:hypothetical protein
MKNPIAYEGPERTKFWGIKISKERHGLVAKWVKQRVTPETRV